MRKFLMFLSIVCSTIAIGSSYEAHAAGNLTSDIIGQVVNSNKRPIKGAVVRLENLETGRVLQATTNARGRYHFTNVRSDGNFQIQAEAEGVGYVRFKPANVMLGHVMRRNFVLGASSAPECQTFGRWQWNQQGKTEAIHSFENACPSHAGRP